MDHISLSFVTTCRDCDHTFLFCFVVVLCCRGCPRWIVCLAVALCSYPRPANSVHEGIAVSLAAPKTRDADVEVGKTHLLPKRPIMIHMGLSVFELITAVDPRKTSEDSVSPVVRWMCGWGCISRPGTSRQCLYLRCGWYPARTASTSPVLDLPLSLDSNMPCDFEDSLNGVDAQVNSDLYVQPGCPSVKWTS